MELQSTVLDGLHSQCAEDIEEAVGGGVWSSGVRSGWREKCGCHQHKMEELTQGQIWVEKREGVKTGPEAPPGSENVRRSPGKCGVWGAQE